MIKAALRKKQWRIFKGKSGEINRHTYAVVPVTLLVPEREFLRTTFLERGELLHIRSKILAEGDASLAEC